MLSSLKAVYILIMIVSGSTSNSVAVIQQEFSSSERCEAARAALIQEMKGSWRVDDGLVSGCFKQ